MLDGTTTVVKAGTGMLTINTTNSYTGATSVRDGWLFVNGTLDQSPVTVWGSKWGLGIIGGSGWLKGGLTVQTGGGVVPGSTTNTAGTLSISNGLTEAGGVVNYFDLSDDPTGTTNDLINVIGNLTLSGTNTIAVNLLNGKVSTGTYPLINYSGTLSGGLSNLTVSGLVALNNLTNLPGQIALVVLSTRAPTNLIWTGSVGSSWDTNASSNWWNGVTLDRFYPLDSVTFTNSAVTNLSLAGALNPASVAVNATVNYRFAGTGYLSGSSGLTKTNSGTLTVLTTNNYTGVTTINGGVLSVAQLANGGVACAIGAADNGSTNLVIDGGGLSYTGPTASTDRSVTLGAGGGTIEITLSSSIFTMSGTTVGSGAMAKWGAGTLALSGSSTYSGGTTISNGVIVLGNATANYYGLGTGTITFNGGTLEFNGYSGGTSPEYGGNANPLAVPAGQYGTIRVPQRFTSPGLAGTLTGSGTLNLYVNYVRGDISGNWTDFTGRINVWNTGTDTDDFRVVNANGFPNARLYVGSRVLMYSRAAANAVIPIGEFSANPAAVISAGFGSSAGTQSAVTWRVGRLNTDATNAATIQGTTTILKEGTGTWVLTGSNTYNGGTTVSNGTLLVNNTTGSGTGTGAVMVVSGAALGGNGFIGGPVTVDGTLTPGSSVGTLTVSNNLVVNAGAVLAYALGTTSDRTVVSGNLTLGGTLNVTNSGGFGVGSYTLFTYGGTLGYNGVSIGSAPSGYNYGIDTGSVGQVKLVVSAWTAFQTWQMQYFYCTNCPQAAVSADPDGDGMSNTNEFLAGTNPTNSLSGLRIISVVQQSNDVVITWTTAGGHTNAVQATGGDANGGYTTNFVDITKAPHIIIPGSGDTTTNYVDVGGVTNSPSRYYRIRLVP
jgi:autotransporter-associated beta strand protein